MKTFKIFFENLMNPKKITVFDFDNTLCFSDSTTKAIRSNGQIEQVSSHYIPKPGENMDFSEWARLINPKINYPAVTEYKRRLDNKEVVIILTARHTPVPVKEFFSTFKVPSCPIFTTEEKKAFLRKLIEVKDFNHIEYFEDHPKYIQDAKELKREFPNVIIKIYEMGSNGLIQRIS